MADKIRPSSTVIVWRRSPRLEVFLVERSMKTRFFPGYHAFPGGVLDAGESFLAAALREVREEIGVALDAASLVEAGRLLTPPFGPTRYDTQFYAAELPPDAQPRVDGVELVSGAWWTPADALRRFREEAFPIPPPTLAYLTMLDVHGDAAKAAALAKSSDGRPHHERFRIELHPGVYALPLKTRTLPPATTTNCYLFDGDPILCVDPGPTDPAERVALFHTLDEMSAAEPAGSARSHGETRARRDGRKGMVVLTHHHGDHTGSAQAVADRYQWPIAKLRGGETLDLGVWGAKPWRVEVLATPGHTPDHVALRDARWGAIVAGDLVSGVSTILIDPGEGDMAQYMASLQACADRKPPVVLPAHGPILPGAAFAKTLEHRRMREAKALAALSSEPQTIAQLVPAAYDDTPQEAWPLAERSLESILLKLEKEGRARRARDGWVRLS